MSLFEKSARQEAEFQKYEDELDNMCRHLEGLAPEADLKEFRSLSEGFRRKVDDFFREDRKLNIGVVGQVKAGKSSFLNTMLFEGKQVLPKASTPKTAVLTKIEYSPQNKIHVQYLTLDEWRELEREAEEARGCGEASPARELVEMARARALDPRTKLAEKRKDSTEDILCDTVEDLQDKLNDFVGEDGRYTPLVNYVTLGVDREELRDLSIVDTPGLNDPVVSRTDCTKQFLEICDVVFFLSQSSSFLDNSDWQLLSEQLPSDGIKRMVLVASKADSAVMDLLPSGRPTAPDQAARFDSAQFFRPKARLTLREAVTQAREKLDRRAKMEIEKFGKLPGAKDSPAYKVLSGCMEPCLVSAMMENMCRKSPADYDPEEKNIHELLKPHFTTGRDEAEDMARIGNFDTVRRAFRTAVDEKDEILSQKGRELIPTARTKAAILLKKKQDLAVSRRDVLENGDPEKLKVRLAGIERSSSALRGDVATIFGEAATSLGTERAEAVKEMRSAINEYRLSERTGKQAHEGSTVTYRHHFLFFRWGKEVSYYTYYTHYKYMVAGDAVEQIRHYTNILSTEFTTVFRNALHLQELKGRLLNAVVKNLDATSDTFDAGLCKRVAEEVVQNFEIPSITLSFDDVCQSISSRFTGEITSGTEQQALISAFSKALDDVLTRSTKTLEEEIERIRKELNGAGERFSSQVLAAMKQEYDELRKKFQNRQQELAQCQQYVACLDELLKQEASHGTTA